MQRFSLILSLFLLPATALAQSYSNAPMLVVGGEKVSVPPGESEMASSADDAAAAASLAPAAGGTAPTTVPADTLLQNFPAAAITRVGENSGAGHVDVPANPPSPTPPANPASPPTPASPASPASPAAPAAPSKLWPRDTVKTFLPACVGLKPALLAPCTCVITQLMAAMPHDEFLKKSENGTIEQDPTLNKIRTNCATAPKQKS